jgi:hypothetical protein
MNHNNRNVLIFAIALIAVASAAFGYHFYQSAEDWDRSPSAIAYFIEKK